MKKYPFIKQEGIKDCGPACLLMIIKYYKGYIPLEELRDLSKTTKYGTYAYHLVETAKKVGFNARGVKKEIDDDIVLPAIAHTVDNNFGHYVVIYEIDKKHNTMIIGNPATKIEKVKIDDFLLKWNNIIIELIPERTIPIIGKVSFHSFIVNYLKDYKKILLSLFISSLLITIFSITSSFYFRIIFEGISKSKSYLTMILLLFIIINLFKMLFDYLRNKVFISFKQKVDMAISCDLYNSIIDLPYKYYRNRTTGEIMTRFDDLEVVRQILYRLILLLFSDIPLILISLIVLFYINLDLTILVIIILSLYTISVLVLNPILKKYINNIQEQRGITNSFMTESIVGFESLNNCSLKDMAKERFSNKYYKLLLLNEKMENIVNIRYFVSDLVFQIGIIIVIYFGALFAYDNVISISILVMFYSIFTSFLSPLKNIIELNLNLNEAKNALKRMLSIFVNKQDKGIINNFDFKNIKFNNLNFYYNDIDLVLSNINFNIKSGEKVLILGKSGSGKSTLLKIIMKYYDVNKSNLFINDIDINNYSNCSIKNNIGYISQQETLFTDNIINNLDCNNIDKVLDISKLCEIESFMNIRNLNFYSIIEENGFNLSGGERQRIILGRLLLKNFKILLIDEGLSQMDVDLERIILKRVFKKYSNKTIIIVSHRTDNMDLYNHIIELNDGKIVKDVVKNV